MKQKQWSAPPRRFPLPLMIVLTLVLILAFAVSVSLYFHSFSNALVEESTGYLSEITEHITVNIQASVTDMQKALEAVGLTFSAIESDASRKAYLNSLCGQYGFEYSGYALPNGTLTATLQSEQKNISGEAYFKRSIQGESVIQYVPVKIFQDKVVSGLLISVPVYQPQNSPTQASGVLVAMLDINKLSDNLQSTGLGKRCATYIIDANGEIVLQTQHIAYGNLYRALNNAHFQNGFSLEEMTANLAAHTAGFAAYSDFGVKKYLHHRYLGIAEWSVVSVMNQTTIASKTTWLTKQLWVLCIFVLIFFPVLLIFSVSAFGAFNRRKQTDKAKMIFLSNMNHEIRSPISTIVDISEKLLCGEMPSQHKERVSCIADAGKQLVSILDDISDVINMETGKLAFANQEYELGSLLQDVFYTPVVRIGNTPPELMPLLDPALPKYVRGDMLRVKQVLLVVLGYAVQLAPHRPIQLEFLAKRQDSRVILTICVTNPGLTIVQSDLDKLFVPLLATDVSQSYSGAGSRHSLVIAQRLCKMMGGDITVEDVRNKGSTFTITLQQTVEKPDLLLSVAHPEQFHLLLLESSGTLRAHWAACLTRLRVSCDFCDDYRTFVYQLEKGDYTHLIAHPSELQQLITERRASAAQSLLMLCSITEQAQAQAHDHVLFAPLFSMQLANELNHSIPE